MEMMGEILIKLTMYLRNQAKVGEKFEENIDLTGYFKQKSHQIRIE
jgi:hypothetical protein